MKCNLLCLLLVAVVGSLSAATSFTGTGVSADLNVSDQHTLAVSISGTFVATIVLERKVSGGYIPQETWTAGITYKPPRLVGVWRLRCSDFTSGTATYTLTSVADNQVIYRKPDGTTAFSVDVDGVVTNSGGATSGGTIDNAVIGGTTPAAGTFTTLFATSVSGPTIDNAIIGGTTPAAGSFTALSATGTATVGPGTGSALAKLDGAAGGSRDLGFYSAGVARFFLRTNTTAESGANAGSDFQILTRSDAGSALITALTITRSTGDMAITGVATHAAKSVWTGGAFGSITSGQGQIYGAAASGLIIAGNGSSTDAGLYNSSGGAFIEGVHATTRVLIAGATDDGTNVLQVNGSAKVSGTTEASAVGTAALIDVGGLGVAKRSFLGTIGSTFKGNVLAGMQDGTAAVAGQVGETISAAQSTYTNYTGSAAYQQAVTIALTAGDWDLHATLTAFANGATITANADTIVALGTTTASAAGTVEGQTLVYIPQNAFALSAGKESVSINVPVSVSATTNYFLNTQATFTVGNPQLVAYLYARRIR